MNILITGGAGFIGSALATELVRREHEVTVLDNLSPQIHGVDPQNSPLVRRLPPAVRLVVGDVRDRNDLSKVIGGQDVIVHLAAETGTGQSMYEIEKYVDVNVGGTSLLLDMLAKKENGSDSVNKIVVASSRAIYGEGKYKGDRGFFYPESRALSDLKNGVFECRDAEGNGYGMAVATDEQSLIRPGSIYGITKQVQEQLVHTASTVCRVESVALRYQNVYGPGQSLKNAYTGILSIFSNLLIQGKPIEVYEDGLESRDFVYIDDVVAATVAAIYSNAGSKSYNVGTGTPTNVLTVANQLKSIYKSNSEINITGRFRLGDIRHNFADLSLAKKDLAFTPEVDFSNGIQKFAEWVKTQEPEESGYERSVAELRDMGLLN